MENVRKELAKINEKLNKVQSSGKFYPEKLLTLVEAQLKNTSELLAYFDELSTANEVKPVAEETIPVDIKEVVALSFENTAPLVTEVVTPVEPEPVAEKKAQPAKTTAPGKKEIPDNSLVGKMKRKPIRDLKTAIGINEKFAFIKLFGGDATAWSNALQKLNSFSSYWEAEAMLSEFSRKYKWKEGDETLQSLMDLVERRYM